jgi:NAD(P)-dependent dehydrogenase (short-subunit alcohol dehydrogenase family)
MEITLAGKTALVTGGSKGIGLAIATRFAASGASVAILARGREALAQAEKSLAAQARGHIVAVAADVSNANDVARAYDEVARALGRIDIVVNNAGASATAPFESITDQAWQQDFDLKLFAAIRLTRLAWPQMKARRWGRVINVLNIGAKAPRAGSAPTSVTRAAGLALTKVLAGEGAPHGVLVNALLVGFIESDQWVRAAENAGTTLEAYLQERGKTVPLGRAGKAEEFANIACFLASDAGAYITGTAINVDGGASPVV